MGPNDANAFAMSDVFNKEPNLQPYVAAIPGSSANQRLIRHWCLNVRILEIV